MAHLRDVAGKAVSLPIPPTQLLWCAGAVQRKGHSHSAMRLRMAYSLVACTEPAPSPLRSSTQRRQSQTCQGCADSRQQDYYPHWRLEAASFRRLHIAQRVGDAGVVQGAQTLEPRVRADDQPDPAQAAIRSSLSTSKTLRPRRPRRCRLVLRAIYAIPPRRLKKRGRNWLPGFLYHG